MKLILAIAFLAMFAGTAQAKRLYGTAGCGLGNMVFGKDTQVLAATTNGSSYSQLFGITSGTSNCTDGGAATAENRLPRFVETNRLALANDIARGQGDTLASVTEIMGCSDANLVGTALQKNYERIFTSENSDASDITNSILGVVKSENALASDCKRVI